MPPISLLTIPQGKCMKSKLSKINKDYEWPHIIQVIFSCK